MQRQSVRLFGIIALSFMVLGLALAGSSPPLASRFSRARKFSIRPDIVWTAGGHSGSVRAVAYAPDGQTVVSGHGDNTYRLWRVSDKALLQAVNGHTSHVEQVALSPDGQIFASSGGDATIRFDALPTAHCCEH